MNVNNHMNYIEMPATDIEATKAFFAKVFGWKYQDFGPDYVAIEGQKIDGGFYRSEQKMQSAQGSALVVLWADDLEGTLSAVEQGGGRIVKPIFSFPGGRRFHFEDPNGNELAVWTTT